MPTRTAPSPTRALQAQAGTWWARLPGLGLTAALTAGASLLGGLAPLVGAPVFGLLLGIVARLVHRPGERLRPGLATASGFLLQLAVVLLGAQLSLHQIIRVGLGSLPVMLGTLVVCLVVCLALAALLGRWLRISRTVTTLIGVGTGICGASAIAAITPLIAADSLAVAYAISTIFLFNIAAVLTFPALGHLLGMSQQAFGLFAGTAVNDTSSVVAAATSYGNVATQHAIVVKLTRTRTRTLIPISLGLAGWHGRTSSPETDPSRDTTSQAVTDTGDTRRKPAQQLRRFLPWFLVGFLLMAGFNSAGLLPRWTRQPLSATAL
jgi:uncharacterized integral membrane protein (TIGR00698 family)